MSNERISREEIRKRQEEQKLICQKCLEYVDDSCLRSCMIMGGEMRIDYCDFFIEKSSRDMDEKGNLRCRHHSKYTGKKKPTSNCDICWRIWMEK
jgi:hypothetical protein